MEIPLLRLVSECCYAAEKGMRAIRREKSRSGDNVQVLAVKKGEDEKSCVTRADHAAQAAIVEHLRGIPGFGVALDIVGEEDEGIGMDKSEQQEHQEQEQEHQDHSSSSLHPVCAQLAAAQIPARLASVPSSALTVFVDPLDGTREFVKNRVENVQTLIGISIRGEPVAGVVGLPFWQMKEIEVGAAPSTVLEPVKPEDLGARHGQLPAVPPVLCGIVGAGLAGLGTLDRERFERRNDDAQGAAPPAQPESTSENINSMMNYKATLPFYLAASSDACEPLASVRRVLCESGFELRSINGAGNKIFHLLLGNADAALFNLKTSRWDTCAPGALLAAAGGTMTDLQGVPITHISMPPLAPGGVEDERYTNSLGVISFTPRARSFLKEKHLHQHASWPAKLRAEVGGELQKLTAFTGLRPLEKNEVENAVQQLGAACDYAVVGCGTGSASGGRRDGEDAAPTATACEQLQATDILRDIDGMPLTKDLLAGCVKNKNGCISCAVTAFSAPESTAIRYLMSEACRVWLLCDGGGAAVLGAEESGERTKSLRSVFVKRSVMRELPHCQTKAVTQPDKLARDVRSYQVETGFLATPGLAAALRTHAGVRIAECLYSQRRPVEDSPIDSAFLTILDDFSPAAGWKQCAMLADMNMLETAVRALARWHAFFWRTTDTTTTSVVHPEKSSVWDIGTFWAPDRQSASMYTNVGKIWEANEYGKLFKGVVEQRLIEEGLAGQVCSVEDLQSVGARLQVHATQLGAEMHCEKNAKTLLHGDTKAANMFFRQLEDNAPARPGV
eukprot:g7019.t1